MSMKTKSVQAPEGWQSLPHHPLACLTEFGAGIDLDRMEAHIRLHGYDRDEAVILFEGKILDHRHLHACLAKLEITPSFREFSGDPVAYVGKKGVRQHLNASQLGMLGASILKLSTAGHAEGKAAAELSGKSGDSDSEGGRSANLQNGGNSDAGNAKGDDSANGQVTQADVAGAVNVSTRTLSDAVKVQANGTEDLQAAVRDGVLKVSRAAKLADKPAAEQDAAVEAERAKKAPVLCDRCKRVGAAKDCPACVQARKDAAKAKKNGKKSERPEDDRGDAYEPRTLDAVGHPIPPGLAESFSSLDRFEEMDSLCRKLQKLLDESARLPGGEQLGRHLKAVGTAEKVTHRSDHLENLKRDLKYTRPHAVCPWCQGRKHKNCKGCQGSGWVAKLTWDEAEEAVKEKLACSR